MISERRRPTTVRVLVHTTPDGQAAVGIVRQEWQGAVRVDYRLARLRPVPAVIDPPPGVSRDLWVAAAALIDLTESLRTDRG